MPVAALSKRQRGGRPGIWCVVSNRVWGVVSNGWSAHYGGNPMQSVVELASAYGARAGGRSPSALGIVAAEAWLAGPRYEMGCMQ